MEFFEVLNKRHCTRKFDPKKPVKKEDLEKIIESGKRAPSAGGIYPTRFFVAKTKEDKNLILESMEKSWVADAPVLIVIWSDPEESIARYGDRAKDLYIIQDAAAAAENIFLAVTALGLATCWMGSFDEEKLKVALNLKNNQRPLVVMPIGYEKK